MGGRAYAGRMAVLTGVPAKCPLCRAEVTLPVTAELDESATAFSVIAHVVADQGTFFAHIRDEHPEEWVQACVRRRRSNAAIGGSLGAMPRKVGGSLLLPGENVGDI